MHTAAMHDHVYYNGWFCARNGMYKNLTLTIPKMLTRSTYPCSRVVTIPAQGSNRTQLPFPVCLANLSTVNMS